MQKKKLFIYICIFLLICVFSFAPLLKLCKNSQFTIDMAKLLVQSGAKVSQECIENLNKNINGFEDLKSFLENAIKSYEIEQLSVEKDEK